MFVLIAASIVLRVWMNYVWIHAGASFLFMQDSTFLQTLYFFYPLVTPDREIIIFETRNLKFFNRRRVQRAAFRYSNTQRDKVTQPPREVSKKKLLFEKVLS